jgi:glycine dehydrogenase
MKANELLGANVAALFAPDEFHRRHIGPSVGEETEMLAAIGYTSRHELIADTVPASILLGNSGAPSAKGAADCPLSIGEPVTEAGALAELAAIAAGNQVWRSYIGAGYYNTITPEPIRRNVLENPGWYTAYTPYQAEIAQGRLEALMNFSRWSWTSPGSTWPTLPCWTRPPPQPRR